jgi:hypothetical protein
MWRFYLGTCAATFRQRKLFVHQTLFSNGPPDELPMTRDALYRECGALSA